MKNEILICKDCHNSFVYYVREQRRFLSNGWEDPIRCPHCRRRKSRKRKGAFHSKPFNDIILHEKMLAA